MRIIAIIVALSVLLFTVGAMAATRAKAPGTTKNLPLSVENLPHKPTFSPESNNAFVCQSYSHGAWQYKVRYFYNRAAQAWETFAYAAHRERLADGSSVPHSPKADKPCPTGPESTGTFIPETRYRTRFCDDCDHRPPPPSWNQVADKFPPPPPRQQMADLKPDRVGSGIPGRYWSVRATYSWITTAAAPHGKWYLTGFRVHPTRTKKR